MVWLVLCQVKIQSDPYPLTATLPKRSPQLALRTDGILASKLYPTAAICGCRDQTSFGPYQMSLVHHGCFSSQWPAGLWVQAEGAAGTSPAKREPKHYGKGSELIASFSVCNRPMFLDHNRVTAGSPSAGQCSGRCSVVVRVVVRVVVQVVGQAVVQVQADLHMARMCASHVSTYRSAVCNHPQSAMPDATSSPSPRNPLAQSVVTGRNSNDGMPGTIGLASPIARSRTGGDPHPQKYRMADV